MRNYSEYIIRTLLIIIVIPIMCSSCGFLGIRPTTENVNTDPNDLSYIYNPSRNTLNPRFNVITKSDREATLGIMLIRNELLFSEANESGSLQSSVDIYVRLFNVTNNRIHTDTLHTTINLRFNEELPEYIVDIPLRIETRSKYNVEVQIKDLLRHTSHHSFIPFNTLSDDNMYNYELLNATNQSDIFGQVIRKDQYFNIRSLKSQPDSLYLYFYKPFETIPDPPSIIVPQKTFDYDPERTVVLPYSSDSPLMLPSKGIYRLSGDSMSTDGITLFNFGPEYPQTTSPETMIEPLVYLTSEAELYSIKTADNLKLALDNFWISCGKNVEKARELIRIYYTRVYYANLFFTSYTEGWKTERGMIYVMYGPPDKLYKTSEGESWGYLKPEIKSRWGNRVQVKEQYIYFNFKQRENQFTDNDYYLSRSESLISNWSQAVSSWRKGVVFRMDNPTDY